MDDNSAMADWARTLIKEAVIEALSSIDGQISLKSAVAEYSWQAQTDVAAMLRFMSTMRSAEFVRKNIPLHLGKAHSQLRRDALEAADINGLFLEFGVWTGTWITHMAMVRPDVQIYGFDSFEGLPTAWSTAGAGHFDLKGVLPQVPANVTLVKGWFSDTLPGFLELRPDAPVSFIDLDCDLHSSTKTVLNALLPRLRVGT